MRRLLALLVLLCAASPALTQTTYQDVPTICSADRTRCDRAIPVVRADGSDIGTPAAPIAANAIAPVVGSLVNGIVGKASPGNAYTFETTTGAAAVYIYVFNSATIPADGAVVAGTANGNYQFCQPIAANTGGRFSYDTPERYSVGITLVVSSTACGTLTKTATAVFLKVRSL